MFQKKQQEKLALQNLLDIEDEDFYSFNNTQQIEIEYLKEPKQNLQQKKNRTLLQCHLRPTQKFTNFLQKKTQNKLIPKQIPEFTQQIKLQPAQLNTNKIINSNSFFYKFFKQNRTPCSEYQSYNAKKALKNQQSLNKDMTQDITITSMQNKKQLFLIDTKYDIKNRIQSAQTGPKKQTSNIRNKSIKQKCFNDQEFNDDNLMQLHVKKSTCYKLLD